MNILQQRRAWFQHVLESPPTPAAVRAMRELLDRWEGGLSGGERREIVEAARAAVARLLRATPEEIILTSGGTEAANLALKGRARLPGREARGLLVSAVEHSSVLHPARSLAREGIELRMLPVDRQGRVEAGALEGLRAGEAALVCVQHANHEVGTLQPLDRVAALARRAGVPLYVDATASAGLARLDVREMGADLVSLSAARLGGVPGSGALWARAGLRLLPQIEGGIQEGGRRGGGENLLGLAALAAAAREAAGQEAQRWRQVRALRDRLERGLQERVEGFTVNGPPAEGRLPGHLHAAFPGVEGESLVHRLRQAGVEASTGSACSQVAGKSSHVLEAMGLGPERSRCSVLFSLGVASRTEEVDRALEATARAVHDLRRIAGFPSPAAVPAPRTPPS